MSVTDRTGPNWATRDLERPCAFIQWKGTDVCMDFYCPCGEQCHFDGDFCYSVMCEDCGRRFQMSAMIEAREIAPDAEHDLWNRAKAPDHSGEVKL